MAGFELVGKEEQQNVNNIFELGRGVAFAHGFDKLRYKFYVRELEQEICKKFNVKYCQAVSSGSAGLYVALRALDVGQGDEIITSCFTFVATIEAIIMTGATPVCIDIDESFNLNPIEIEKAITNKTKVILPVHMAGACADMGRITEIAKKYNLKILEDACQAMGSQYNNDYSGTIGDIGIYSLDAGKIIQCGEGGLIVTNDEELYKRYRAIHDHGHDYTGARAQEIPQTIGFNFRMTEMQAAYALAQLDKLDYILEKQKENYDKIISIFTYDNKTPSKPRKILGKQADDNIILIFDNKQIAQKVIYNLSKNGIGTKNIPDALNWHFAGNWKHIFSVNLWRKSEELLYRSVAIPVPVIMDEDYPERVYVSLKEI